MKSFSDQLRALVKAESAKRSRRQICLDAKIDPSQLHRFLKGEGRLTNDSIDRLVRTLGLRLTKGGK